MRLLLDENVEYRLAGWLRAQGHDVTAIAYDYPASLKDREVLAIAHRERRILLTNDRDFGELIVRHQQQHAGVIYFRMPAATAEEKLTRLQAVFAQHAGHLERLIVVTETAIRVHHEH
jgi:predicted nuclease of predicted toxin-antitoxin system